jgi:hypothetical protein
MSGLRSFALDAGSKPPREFAEAVKGWADANGTPLSIRNGVRRLEGALEDRDHQLLPRRGQLKSGLRRCFNDGR